MVINVIDIKLIQSHRRSKSFSFVEETRKTAECKRNGNGKTKSTTRYDRLSLSIDIGLRAAIGTQSRDEPKANA